MAAQGIKLVIILFLMFSPLYSIIFLSDVVTDKRKQTREAAKKRKRGKNLSKPLEIWEIQQSLKRGEFVEVKLSVLQWITNEP